MIRYEIWIKKIRFSWLRLNCQWGSGRTIRNLSSRRCWSRLRGEVGLSVAGSMQIIFYRLWELLRTLLLIFCRLCSCRSTKMLFWGTPCCLRLIWTDRLIWTSCRPVFHWNPRPCVWLCPLSTAVLVWLSGFSCSWTAIPQLGTRLCFSLCSWKLGPGSWYPSEAVGRPKSSAPGFWTVLQWNIPWKVGNISLFSWSWYSAFCRPISWSSRDGSWCQE